MHKAERLMRYARLIARHRDGGVEAIPDVSFEEVVAATNQAEPEFAIEEGAAGAFSPDPSLVAMADAANRALEKIKLDRPASDYAPEEVDAFEAIIFPRERPAVDIVGGEFEVGHDLWRDLNVGDVRARLVTAIPSIGRIGLPGQTRIPYAGTGFVVGDGLLMTNRHVAEVFARGLGTNSLHFKLGFQANVDFLRERDNPAREELAVRSVRLIHPYWDMALLEVEGLAHKPPLELSIEEVGNLEGRRVAVIGYPAFDPQRNDVTVQNQLFSGVYGVKRLQPGHIHERRNVGSFRRMVPAGTHDCSTLGGNSGSAVIDLDSGRVLGLHFGGRYEDINYFVPASELARDGRVVDSGVNFVSGAAGGTPPWDEHWPEGVSGDARDEPPRPSQQASTSPSKSSPVLKTEGKSVSFTIPLTITVRLGTPETGDEIIQTADDVEERLAEPWRDTDYARRAGYQDDFLAGRIVPMPKPADPSLLAPLRDGSDTLHYTNFSIQMHRTRRLALLTAANVTGEKSLRRPEPGFDYTRRALSGLGENDQEKWFRDPRIAPEFQLSDRFYTQDDKSFDKGHVVRRDDVAWGASYAALRQANGDTYHVTNCSPQVAQFNQSARGVDNWGDLENLVLRQAASERYCLFAGPVLNGEDDIFVGKAADGSPLRVRIPRAYWKVVVAPVDDGIASYAFVLEQDLSDVELEFAVTDEFRRAMVSIPDLERRTGLVFPDVVRNSDRFDDEEGLGLAVRHGIDRAVTVGGDDARVARQPGDDEEAARELSTPEFELDTAEGPDDFRLARALDILRAQINVSAPRRSKKSDGWIGDAKHKTRSSDHNPWVRDAGIGVVTAIDVTHDVAGGCDAGELAEALRRSRDKRIKYLIWNRRIANRDAIDGDAAWAWRPYKGKNPHAHHVHISVQPTKALYDAVDGWQI